MDELRPITVTASVMGSTSWLKRSSPYGGEDDVNVDAALAEGLLVLAEVVEDEEELVVLLVAGGWFAELLLLPVS